MFHRRRGLASGGVVPNSLRSYAVIFEGITVLEFTTAMDECEAEIPNWMTQLPQTVFVVTRMSAPDLSAFLRAKLPKMERILVLSGKNTDRSGRLPQSAWDFLDNPAVRAKPPQWP